MVHLKCGYWKRDSLNKPRTGRMAHAQPYFKAIWDQIGIVWEDTLGRIGMILLFFFILLALFGPFIAPYGAYEKCWTPDGKLERMQSPSWRHPMGTTYYGRDVLSQVILGTRQVVIVGFVSALMVVVVGTNIGLVCGYYKGNVDNLLMRLTDIVYGIPFLPFAIVLISIIGKGVSSIIIAIVLILWRSTSRVIRSQVLSLRERPFVLAVKVSGASDFRVIYKHIAPNILPMAFLYASFAIAWAVAAEASISFLGLGDPNTISWGQILFYAFLTQGVTSPYWWIIPPGVCIMLLVMSAFFIGRAYEKVANPQLRER